MPLSHEAPYRVDWVTEFIAVGGAPVSYDQLSAIRRQGVNAIVNLCADYCDLHDIEKEDDGLVPCNLLFLVGWVRPLFGRNPTPMAPAALGYASIIQPTGNAK